MKGWSGFRRYGRYVVLFSTLIQWFDNLYILDYGKTKKDLQYKSRVRCFPMSLSPCILWKRPPLGHSNHFIESSTNQEKLQYRAFGCIGTLKDMLLWRWIPVIIEAEYHFHFMSSRDMMHVSLICTLITMKQSYPTENNPMIKKDIFSGTLPIAWCQIWW